VNFTDIYGRKIGYDYTFILEKIKAQFPASRTSRDWVRKMASELNQREKMPVRGRLNKISRNAYAMSLLVSKPADVTYLRVRNAVCRKFPQFAFTVNDLRRLERKLVKLGFAPPERVAPKRRHHGV
jgi:hypothetical protein